MRLAETGPAPRRVPSACAKSETRSSSSSHLTSRSSGAGGRPAGHAASRASSRSSQLADDGEAVAVGPGCGGQPLQAPRRGLQIALEIGQPRGARLGGEALVHERSELAADVAPRVLERLGGERVEAPPDVAREVEHPHDPGHDRRGPVGQLAGHVVPQAPEGHRVPRRPAGLVEERVDRGRRRVLEHGRGARVRRAGQRELRAERQPVLHEADRRGHREREQTAGARAHRLGLRGGRVEQRHADGVALVDQGRVRAHAAARCRAGRPRAGASRAPTRAARGARAPARRPPARARRRGRSCSRSASRSGPSASALPSSSSTRKVIRRCGGSAARSHVPGGDADAARALERRREDLEQRPAARRRAREEPRGRVGDRDERAAQVLGQGAQQGDRELVAEAGDEPVEAGRAQAPEQRERHVHRHAVRVAAGLEAVGEPERRLALAPGVGQRARVRRCAGPAARAGRRGGR